MKHLLFDFDGVIVDSFQISFETTNLFLTNKMSENEYRARFNGNIYDTKEIDVLMHQNQEDNILDENDPFFKKYVPLLLEIEPVKGIKEVLAELVKMHQMSIISSTISEPITRYLKKYDLDYFESVYGGDIDKNKRRKIMAYLEKYNITPNEVLFITDTLGDIEEAKSTGVQAIAVNWGYQAEPTLKLGAPVCVVHKVKELLTVIKKM